MHKKISALMILQNEELYVKESILSVIEYVNQVVILDNCSTDNTVGEIEVLLRNPETSTKIKLIKCPNKLLMHEAFTLGKQSIDNEWLIRWDGDFISYEEKDTHIKKLFEKIDNMNNNFDGLFFYAINLMGDYSHVSKNEHKIYNLFACKKNVIEFGYSDKYAITYKTIPGSKFLYMNNPRIDPCYVVHLSMLHDDERVVYNFHKNAYNLYLLENKDKANICDFKRYFYEVLNKNITVTAKWLSKNYNGYIKKHNYLIPKRLENFGNVVSFSINYINGIPIRETRINGKMTNNYSICVIIRVYHNSEYLESCLESIFKQTYKNFQVVIINDNRTPIGENKYLSDNFYKSFIRFIDFEEYLGPIKTYQTALLHAETDVVAFVENMDILENNCLEEIMNVYNTQDFNIFVYGLSKEKRTFKTFKPIHYYLTEGLDTELYFGSYLEDQMSQLEKFAKPVVISNTFSKPQYDAQKDNHMSYRSTRIVLDKHETRNSKFYYPEYITSMNNILPKECFTENELCSDHKIQVNEYFDHVYVINLEKDIVKKYRLVKIFADLNIKAEFFPAVYGRDHYSDFLSKCNKEFYVVGAYGYTMSMHKILNDAKKRKFQKILVFDDDVIFHHDFANKFNNFVRCIPYDWYVLSLGVSGPWNHPFTNADYQKFNYTKLYTNSFTNVAGSHAMGYSSEVFDEIINITSTFNHAYDDEILQYYTEKYLTRCYAAMPHLVLSDSARSDIGKKCFKMLDNYLDYHFRYRINLGQYDMNSLYHKKYNLLEIDYKPLVSIIMTVYDKEDYLEDSIQSILNQTYSNIELVIVEDKSPDKCYEILSKYKNHPKITLLFNAENVGCYVSRNRALQVCKGEYIGFQDADDYSLSTRVEKQITLMIKDGLKVSATDMLRSHIPDFKGLTETEIIEKANNARTHYDKSDGNIKFSTCCEHYFNYPTMIFDKEIFEKFGNFIEYRKGMDMEYGERLIYKYDGKIFKDGEDSWEYFQNMDTFYYKKIPEMLVISSEMTTKNITSHVEYNAEFEKRKKLWRQSYANEFGKKN